MTGNIALKMARALALSRRRAMKASRVRVEISESLPLFSGSFSQPPPSALITAFRAFQTFQPSHSAPGAVSHHSPRPNLKGVGVTQRGARTSDTDGVSAQLRLCTSVSVMTQNINPRGGSSLGCDPQSIEKAQKVLL
jgi:hypothetical protein